MFKIVKSFNSSKSLIFQANYCFSKSQKIDAVIFDFEKLKSQNSNLYSEIEVAFGFDGIGLAIVKNIPGYIEARQRLLPLAHQLANLQQEKLHKLERPEAFYAIGWSHGKEQFGGKYDFSKGSFYSNPIYEKSKNNPEVEKVGAIPNVWPKEDLPDLEHAVKNLGKTMAHTQKYLAYHLDKYISKNVSGFEPGQFHRMITETTQYSGRLLHYFASKNYYLINFHMEIAHNKQSDDNKIEDNWCGWHNDHSALTALTSALYIGQNGKSKLC